MLVTASAQQWVVRTLQIFGVSIFQLILGVFLGATRPPARRLAAVLSAPFRGARYGNVQAFAPAEVGV